MIENFELDPRLGQAGQIGLFIKADGHITNAFLRVLRGNGFQHRGRMPSRVSNFDYFTYVSRPDSGLDQADLHQQLQTLCQNNRVPRIEDTVTSPDYETWRSQFSTYIQNYQHQQFVGPIQQQADTFDKAHACQLIEEKQFDAAASYLQQFVRDPLPSLLPSYLIFLYHKWGRRVEVRAAYEQYASHLRAGVVNHQVIAWAVEAYLADSKPEQALAILNDYLPEFQRQGVADRLLDLRAQAQALRGHLPQTAPELHNFIGQQSPQFLTERLDDILDVINGTPAGVDSRALFDTLEARLDPNQRWSIQVARSAWARQHNDLPEALALLLPLVETPPPAMTTMQCDLLRLQTAALQSQLEQFQSALNTLNNLDVTNLSETDQSGYWAQLGQTYEALAQPEEALLAFHQAYALDGLATNQLRRLARLAYQAGDLPLAQQVYTDLFQTEFTPDDQDHIYAGIIAWLEDDNRAAIDHLQSTLLELLPDQAPVEAFEALTKSLIATQSPADDLVPAVAAWTDHLVVKQDPSALESLANTIAGLNLGRETIYHLLEPIEAVLIDQPDRRSHLAQLYSNLLFTEINQALSRNQAMPAYVLDLRRSLLALSQAQFDAAQQYLTDKLASARESLGQEISLEPETTPTLDLGNKWVALIGGYDNVRRRVQERLTNDYGLTKFTEVAPSWEETVSEKKIRQAVGNADLIVVVHRCLKHDGTDALSNVTTGTGLSNRIRYAPGKGHSSIIRVVTEHFNA